MKYNLFKQHILRILEGVIDKGRKYINEGENEYDGEVEIGRKLYTKIYGRTTGLDIIETRRFNLTQETIGFILGTKPKYDDYYMKLPFDNIYLDVDLPTKDGWKIDGIYFTHIDYVGRKNIITFIFMHSDIEFKHGCVGWMIDNKIKFRKLPRGMLKGEGQKIKDFIMGVFNFIHSKDVRLIYKEYSNLQLKKRMKRNQCTLKDYIETKISGEIKRYITSDKDMYSKIYHGLFKPGSRGILRRHEVRGHWRLLSSSMYKGKRFQSIWIRNYEKGVGKRIKQTWKLVKKEDDKQ